MAAKEADDQTVVDPETCLGVAAAQDATTAAGLGPAVPSRAQPGRAARGPDAARATVHGPTRRSLHAVALVAVPEKEEQVDERADGHGPPSLLVALNRLGRDAEDAAETALGQSQRAARTRDELPLGAGLESPARAGAAAGSGRTARATQVHTTKYHRWSRDGNRFA
jgi:hypothetical protein